MTTLYHHHGVTGEYLGQSEARLDPIDKKPLIPANAVTEKPPAVPAKKKAVRVGGTSGGWMAVDDFRGETWFKGHGKPVEITDLGTPQGMTRNEPQAPIPRKRNKAEIEATIDALIDGDSGWRMIIEALAENQGMDLPQLRAAAKSKAK